MRNTHLQVVCSLIAAPIMGPRRYEKAKDIAVMLEYSAYFEGGTISVMIASVTDVIPDPPSPCSARKVILKNVINQCRNGEASHLTVVGSSEQRHRLRKRS